MKKLLILVLILFMLCGCTGNNTNEPEPNNNTNTNTNNTDNPKPNDVVQGDDFPFEEMEGYWTNTKGGSFLRIYKNDKGDYCFEDGDFKDFSTGEVGIISIEKTGEKTYFFKTKHYELGDLIGDKVIDITNLDMYKILVGEDEYVYCGPDFYQANLANNWYINYSFMEKLMGYWNSDVDNSFVCFSSYPDGTFLFTPGLYDSEPGGTGVVDYFELLVGNEYNLHVHNEDDDTMTYLYEIDLTNVANKKIVVEGLSMHYAGEDFDTAYADYQKNFPY